MDVSPRRAHNGMHIHYSGVKLSRHSGRDEPKRLIYSIPMH